MILLYCYMGAVAVVLLLVGVMEAEGLRNNVQGANGFLWTMALLAMGTLLFAVALATWIFFDFRTALGTLVLGGGWLGLTGWVSMKIMMSGARSK